MDLPDERETRSFELSDREKEILIQVASGASNKEIAQALSISSNTVKVHLRNIFAKINAASRTEAAMYAIKTGLVPGAPADLPPELNGAEEAPASAAELAQAAPGGRSRQQIMKIILYATAGLFVGLVTLFAIFNRPGANLPAPTPTPGPAWTVFPELLAARSGAAAAAGDNLIFVIGGQDASGPTGAFEHFSLATRSWKTLPDKPTPVSGAGAAVIGGKIYVAGGLGPGGQPVSAFEIYDIAGQAWSDGPDLPHPLHGYAHCAFEGRLYLFGGITPDGLSDQVLRFDPAIQAWEEIARLPTPTAFGGASVVGNAIYLLGGWDGREILDTTRIFAPTRENDPWSSGPSLPAPRMKMGVATIADIIHLVGGVSQDGGQSQELPTLVLSSGSVQWQSLGSGLADRVESPVLVSQGAILYLIGGTRNGQPSREVKAFQAIFTTLIPMIIK